MLRILQSTVSGKEMRNPINRKSKQASRLMLAFLEAYIIPRELGNSGP